ncbi:uroporphyrinogen-III synthase [Ancylobacter lacus]|uniref:uroporphyrinogen-III synthase n=1 Tax=Ancylobacter lacus TaxID=2579970 RepID=UPI001BCACD08|nr:uroporphyrinogen-III synthase [Ancylobacter lacus]MBS7541071.1 uroporphyrinogen-III synthase [Ancylobacter lacus]
MRLLVTRPQPDAAATAGRLRADGHEVVIDPMLTVEPRPATLPEGRFDAVALTSVNGARLLRARPEAPALSRLPLYAVGKRTAAAAEGLFPATSIAGGDGAALAALLRDRLPRGSRLLHVAGEDRAADLAEALAPAGIAVDLFVIYRTCPASTLGEAARAALAEGRIDAALHFSPKTAATLVACCAAAGLTPALARCRHLCLSRGVAAPLAAIGAPTQIAAEPTEEALLGLVGA